MPQPIQTDTHTGITAEHERKLRRHAVPVGGFDPNADPVVIGLGAGTTTLDNGVVVIGSGAWADNGQAGMAIGHNAYANHYGATAIGAGAGADLSDDPTWDSDPAVVSNQLAVGVSAQATAIYATAVGPQAAASAEYAVALGRSATASADFATALGDSALAGADHSIAIGYQANSTNAPHGVCIGRLSSAGDDYAVAIGYDSSATGDSSIAIGRGTFVTAAGATALGQNANVGHASSTAIGKGAATTAANQIMLGTSTETVKIAGKFDASALPTSDPGVSGLVWRNAGVLTVS